MHFCRALPVLRALSLGFILENRAQMWSPQFQESRGSVESVQRRVAEMIQEMEHFHYEDRLRELGLFNLEMRRF